MVASEWNPPNEDGTLQNVEDDWALAPGTTSRYYAASVTIPEDWEGPKQLEVYVTAAYGSTVHTEGGLFAEASESSIEFLPDKRAASTIRLPSSMSLFARPEDSELTRADVKEVGRWNGGSGNDGGAGGNGSNPGGSGSCPSGSGAKPNGANSTVPSRSSLASTGDNTAQTAMRYAMGGLAGLAAGAALHAHDGKSQLHCPCGAYECVWC